MADCAVLVVDDNLHIAATVATILQLEGYATETAANGQEALEKVEQHHPRVVLLDMRMPVLNGWDFAREIEARGLEVKIVVMSAARDAWAWAEQIHADGCLTKPFGMDDLLSEVDRLCAT